MLLVIVAVLMSAHISHAHMRMDAPVPRRSPLSTYAQRTNTVDYDLSSPLNADGSNFPCKRYTAEPVVNSYSAGGVIPVTIGGSANHNGGHCQFAISYDNGKTWTVLLTVVRDCIKTQFSYQVPIPLGAPSCTNCVFAWTWINASGNREYYMNCADIAIQGGTQSGYSAPELFVANLPSFPTIGEFASGADDGSAYFARRCMVNVALSGSTVVTTKTTNCGTTPAPTSAPVTPTTAPTTSPTSGPTAAPSAAPTAAPTLPPAPTPTILDTTAKKVIYVDYRDVDWSNAGNTVRKIVDAGYNVVNIAFWMSSGAADLALVWQTMSAADRQSTMTYVRSKGAKVIVSAGGATESPYTAMTGTAYGTAVATWAKNNLLDGVDFDLENFSAGFVYPPLSATQLVQWLVDATNAARTVLGSSGIITHAPQAPYFKNSWTGNSGGYSDVYAQVGAQINWFNVQFYNQGPTCYTSYESLFTQSNINNNCPSFPGTSVNEIASTGIPLSKIVVGKYNLQNDGGNGFVSATQLNQYFSRAATSLGWKSGVMVWAWAAANSAQWIADAWPTSVAPTSGPTSAPTSGPTSVPVSPCGNTQCCASFTCAQAGFPGYCCSKYGWCGTTSAYCDATQGCQNGPCTGGTAAPTSGPTSGPTSAPTVAPTVAPAPSAPTNCTMNDPLFICNGCALSQCVASWGKRVTMNCPAGTTCVNGACTFGVCVKTANNVFTGIGVDSAAEITAITSSGAVIVDPSTTSSNNNNAPVSATTGVAPGVVAGAVIASFIAGSAIAGLFMYYRARRASSFHDSTNKMAHNMQTPASHI